MSALLRCAIALLVGGLLLMFHIALVALGCLTYVYLLPGVIAMKRCYAGADRIFIACAVTGWTVIGWIAALAFALALPDASDDAVLATQH